MAGFVRLLIFLVLKTSQAFFQYECDEVTTLDEDSTVSVVKCTENQLSVKITLNFVSLSDISHVTIELICNSKMNEMNTLQYKVQLHKRTEEKTLKLNSSMLNKCTVRVCYETQSSHWFSTDRKRIQSVPPLQCVFNDDYKSIESVQSFSYSSNTRPSKTIMPLGSSVPGLVPVENAASSPVKHENHYSKGSEENTILLTVLRNSSLYMIITSTVKFSTSPAGKEITASDTISLRTETQYTTSSAFQSQFSTNHIHSISVSNSVSVSPQKNEQSVNLVLIAVISLIILFLCMIAIISIRWFLQCQKLHKSKKTAEGILSANEILLHTTAMESKITLEVFGNEIKHSPSQVTIITPLSTEPATPQDSAVSSCHILHDLPIFSMHNKHCYNMRCSCAISQKEKFNYFIKHQSTSTECIFREHLLNKSSMMLSATSLPDQLSETMWIEECCHHQQFRILKGNCNGSYIHCYNLHQKSRVQQ